MNQALFFKDNIKQIISAESISSRKEYLEKYRGHLFCPHPTCPAHISFAETPTFKIKKMFKTSKNSTHTEDCPYRISHTGTNKRYISAETVNHALSDNHKRDILKKLYFRNQSSDPSTSVRSHYHSQSTVTSASELVISQKAIASVNPDALPTAKGQREPVVKKRRCSDILPEDVGKLLGLDDYAISADISDDYVKITLKSNVTLLFYNAFRDSNSVAFSLLKELTKEFMEKKFPLLICFIGNVEKTSSGYQVQVMHPSLVTFNDDYIYNYHSAA